LNLLFVCRRNLSRSVVAAAIARSKLGDRTDVEIEAAGLFVTYEGKPAPVGIVALLNSIGIDASVHRRKALTIELIDWATLVLVADSYIRDTLHRLLPAYADRIKIMSKFDPLNKKKFASVPDIGAVKDPERYKREVIAPITRPIDKILGDAS
jgi:protein-tyrosine-phosphatase